MFATSDLIWSDFEVASAVDLKAAGTLRYATDASTRAIVLAYAIGDAPALAWHADGAISRLGQRAGRSSRRLRSRRDPRRMERELRQRRAGITPRSDFPFFRRSASSM